MYKPYIILVCPQLAENIGSVARVMSNFGLENLRIVSPRDGWPPDNQAFKLAAKGCDILHNAVIYNDINLAISDLNFIIASTARNRYMQKEKMDPKELVSYCNKKFNKNTKIGILFGRENNGLTNEEVSLADVVSVIPTDTINPSLNLAQAVSIFSYEFFSYIQDSLDNELKQICNKSEFSNFFDILISLLDEKNYFKESNIKKNMIQNIRNIFAKAELNSQEIRTLIGIIKNLVK